MRREYACGFLNICEDTKKLEESEKRGNVSEDLVDQHEELCRTGGLNCLLKEQYESKAKGR